MVPGVQNDPWDSFKFRLGRETHRLIEFMMAPSVEICPNAQIVAGRTQKISSRMQNERSVKKHYKIPPKGVKSYF